MCKRITRRPGQFCDLMMIDVLDAQFGIPFNISIYSSMQCIYVRRAPPCVIHVYSGTSELQTEWDIIQICP